MNTKVLNWNGFDVHGDIKQLDHIVESSELINLDYDDILRVLSSDGENWIQLVAASSLMRLTVRL